MPSGREMPKPEFRVQDKLVGPGPDSIKLGLNTYRGHELRRPYTTSIQDMPWAGFKTLQSKVYIAQKKETKSVFILTFELNLDTDQKTVEN